MFKHSKFKRFIAMVLLLTIVFPTPTEIKADSNDRRKTWINLAKGKQLTEMSEVDLQNMSEDELRTIALYLSNFYVMWKTKLNIEAGEGIGVSEEYNGVTDIMVSALSDYCGFDKDIARFLVAKCLAYDVSTRKQLYVKKKHLEAVDKALSVRFATTIREGTLQTYTSKNQYLGFYNWKDGEYNKNLGYICSLDDYCKVLGTETVNDEEYVPLTYPVFMTLMSCSYDISLMNLNLDNGSGQPDTTEDGNFDDKSDSWYYRRDISDIYAYYNDKGDKVYKNAKDAKGNKIVIPNAKTRFVPFYWIDESAEKATCVFGTTNECLKMYALVNNNTDFENGYGSAFLSVSPEIFVNLPDDEVLNCTAFGQRLYTNWVGDILLDNRIDLYTIFPGCANPFMLTHITDQFEGETRTDIKYLCNRLNLINVYALKHSKYLSKGDGEVYAVYTDMQDLKTEDDESCTIYTTDVWRYYPRSSDWDWDKSNLPNTFGDMENSYRKIKNLLDQDKYNSAFKIQDGNAGADYFYFPSWRRIRTYSYVWTKYGEDLDGVSHIMKSYYNPDGVYHDNYEIGIMASTGSADELSGIESVYSCLGNQKWRIDDNDDTAYRSRWLNGASKANSTILTYNNLAGLSDNMDLNDFFASEDAIKVHKKIRDKLNANPYTSILKTDNKISYSKDTKEFFQPLFLTYSFAYFNAESITYEPDVNVINLKMQKDLFPSASDVAIDWEEIELSSDTTTEEVISFLYFLLHPVKGIKYVATWLKNKIGGFLLGWHEDMVGSSDSNSSLGGTQYVGTSGYVTTPSLHDVSWMDNLLAKYNDFVVYILILLAVILILYIILGQITVQKALIGFILLGICAILPPRLINAVADTTNTICETIYSEKFDYWGIVQTEEYLGLLDTYNNAETNEDAVASLLMLNGASEGKIASETSYTGMRLKWISPKKYNDLAPLSDAMQESGIFSNKNSALQTMVINSISSQISGESFSDNADATFMYRDMIDIYRYGSISYSIFENDSSFRANKDYANGFSTKDGTTSTTTESGELNTSVVRDANVDSRVAKHWYYKRDSVGAKEGISVFFDNTGVTVKKNNLLNTIEYNIESADKTSMFYRVRANTGVIWKTQAVNDTSSLSSRNLGFINDKFDGASINNYYTYNNLSNTLLTLFDNTYRTIGLYNIKYKFIKDTYVDCGKNAMANWDAYKSNNLFADFPSGFNYTLQSLKGNIEGTLSIDSGDYFKTDTYKNLCNFYYGLYSESPYYFMNYEFRDVLKAKTPYTYNRNNLVNRGYSSNGVNNVISLMLKDKQEYFYNYTDTDGYGELKDFMNMHDFFYFVIPSMKSGVELIRNFDKDFGFYTYDTCPLRIQADGSFKYNSETIIDSNGEWVSSTAQDTFWKSLNDQQRYEFWHDLNVNLLSYYCCSWLDTMYDCSYAEPEKIVVLGKSFEVQDPLNPMSYFQLDDKGNLIKGRYMVFSRSEMKYYGLKESDLTSVESRIIQMQDSVYKKVLDLTNYYNLSDETLIHNYCLLQLFEFDKAFSEERKLSESHILYPQGYELKTMSYDGFLRLAINASTGDDLMTTADSEGNKSIYFRVMEKTSILFPITLLLNDIIAVVAIPAFRMIFLVVIFILSVAIILACVVQLELNVAKVVWKSLLAPMLAYSLVTICLALVVSFFLSNGASEVTNNEIIIQLGDPTMLLLVFLVINITVIVMYFRICKKCIYDLKYYAKTAVTGIVGVVTGVTDRLSGLIQGEDDKGGISSAKRRSENNNPKNNSHFVRNAALAGIAAHSVKSKIREAGSSTDKVIKKTGKGIKNAIKTGSDNRYNTTAGTSVSDSVTVINGSSQASNTESKLKSKRKNRLRRASAMFKHNKDTATIKKPNKAYDMYKRVDKDYVEPTRKERLLAIAEENKMREEYAKAVADKKLREEEAEALKIKMQKVNAKKTRNNNASPKNKAKKKHNKNIHNNARIKKKKNSHKKRRR